MTALPPALVGAGILPIVLHEAGKVLFVYRQVHKKGYCAWPYPFFEIKHAFAGAINPLPHHQSILHGQATVGHFGQVLVVGHNDKRLSQFITELEK